MAAIADLHVHTTNSDGALELSALPEAARRAGLKAVAVTDHDRTHPDLDEPVTDLGGVTVVHGIELRVDAGQQRVDLLGYGLEPTDALQTEVERLQHDRIERGVAIVECVEDRLGIDLDIEGRTGLGRPHIARAIDEHPGTAVDFQGAFDDLIGDGRPCYVARDVPDVQTGRELLDAACALVGLAHPLRYDDPAAALELTADLDAVERWYPYNGADGEAGVDAVDRAIGEHDLLATGGSDAHDAELGVVGLDREAWEPIKDRLSAERQDSP